MTKAVKVVVVIGSVAIVLAGGYLAYTYLKPSKPKDGSKDDKKPVEEDKNIFQKAVDTVSNVVHDVIGTDSPFPLSVGSKGQNVKDLQTLLNSLGASLDVDGDFGSKTKSALMGWVVGYPPFQNGTVDSNGMKFLRSKLPVNSGIDLNKQEQSSQGGNILTSFGFGN